MKKYFPEIVVSTIIVVVILFLTPLHFRGGVFAAHVSLDDYKWATITSMEEQPQGDDVVWHYEQAGCERYVVVEPVKSWFGYHACSQLESEEVIDDVSIPRCFKLRWIYPINSYPGRDQWEKTLFPNIRLLDVTEADDMWCNASN